LVKELTAAAIENYRPGPERRRIRDAKARSLFLVIEPSGHKSFQMRFRRPDGKPAKLTLGPVDFSRREVQGDPQIGQPLTLAAARFLATKVHRERELGHDPIGEHKASKHRQRAEVLDREDSTFAVAVRDYVESYARRKTRNWRETARLLGLLYVDESDRNPEPSRGGLVQRWADRDVGTIDDHDIFEMIEEARNAGVPGIKARNRDVSEARARMLFVALSSMFSWLKDKRRVGSNPCAGVSRPDQATARERVLKEEEVVWFLRACDTVGEPFGTVCKLLLLTGARLNEVAGMNDAELTDDRSTWSLPATRTKNKRPYAVPLPPLARALIAKVKRKPGAALLFTTTGTTPVSGWGRAKERLDAAMLIEARRHRRNATIPPWRLHDLRRTAVTNLVELGIAPHVVELVVNHISGHKAGVAGIYNKSELLPERRAALERWAAHIEGLVSGRRATVTPIQRPHRGGRA
jgi:integrase